MKLIKWEQKGEKAAFRELFSVSLRLQEMGEVELFSLFLVDIAIL